MVVRIAEDADDFGVHRNVAALCELLADGLGPAEILRGKRLVDESQLSRSTPIVPGEVAAHRSNQESVLSWH